jgi:para-aminobenzoate synthetase component I
MYAQPLDADVALPDLALRLSHLPGLCWLDGDGGGRDGRWSFLGTDPVARLSRPLCAREPLAAFDGMEASRETQQHATVAGAPLAEQVPRWAGYVAYDAHFAGTQQRLVRTPQRPALSFARYDALFAFDHACGRAFVVGDDRAACARLIGHAQSAPARPLSARAGKVSATAADQHARAIECALDRIAAGEIYQVNLARCFSAAFEGAPLALFAALRAASPVPLGFYYDDGARVVLARTMERFLRWERAARQLYTRPIKGTIARSGGRDDAEAQALRGDGKERAEHTMIVDLMRNDLGRIAQTGSVHVSNVMTVEPYAGLLHLATTIGCRTREGTSLHQVLEATFPPGSVTGTPKLRAIDIIEQLESEPRDAYTGAVGFVDREGGLSLAVAIRTAIVETGQLRYFAGGGIVEASAVAREIAETELKARVLFDALRALGGERLRDNALSSAPVLR